MSFFSTKKHLYNKGKLIQKITILSFLLSISFILYFVTSWIPWPLASFLKVDISLLPIIIALFLFKLKDTFILLISRMLFAISIALDPTIWVGPTVQIIISTFFILSLLITKKILTKFIKKDGIVLILSFLISSILTSIFATINNWWWITPLYARLYLVKEQIPLNPYGFNEFLLTNKNINETFKEFSNWHSTVWFIYMPFNLVKFGIISLLSIPLILRTCIYFTNKKYKFR